MIEACASSFVTDLDGERALGSSNVLVTGSGFTLPSANAPGGDTQR